MIKRRKTRILIEQNKQTNTKTLTPNNITKYKQYFCIIMIINFNERNQLIDENNVDDVVVVVVWP